MIIQGQMMFQTWNIFCKWLPAAKLLSMESNHFQRIHSLSHSPTQSFSGDSRDWAWNRLHAKRALVHQVTALAPK